MVEYKRNVALMLTVHRNTETFLVDSVEPSYVLGRLTASHTAYPVTELDIMLPMDGKNGPGIDELVSALHRQTALRHVRLFKSTARGAEQLPRMMQCLATMPALESVRIEAIDCVLPTDTLLSIARRTRHSFATSYARLESRALPQLAAACTHLSELSLNLHTFESAAKIQWHKLLAESTQLQALAIEVTCSSLLQAIGRNTSLCRLWISDDDFDPVRACSVVR
jgi:hypothetical protein